MNAITPDKYQRAVINSTKKDILVLAGAGSGKTFTLLNKICNLVEKGVNAENILVLTFTRVASINMREKYLEMRDTKHEATPDFFTFHAFCYSVLLQYPEIFKALGYESLPTIADDITMSQYEMQAKNLCHFNLTNKDISMVKRGKLRGPKKLKYENYCQILDNIIKSHNVIDMNTLSEGVCNLFKINHECIIPVTKQYKYLFVDEFQDTDENQYEFVKSMTKCRRVLCGDALQNIYQFRGCSNEPLKELVNDEEWSVYRLPINYRSSYKICDYVNNLSSNFISKKYRIELQSDIAGPNVRECYSEHEDKYEDLYKYVIWASKQGNVAVLCRTNEEVYSYSNYLKSCGITVTNNKDSDYAVDILKCALSEDYMYSFLVSNLSNEDYSSYIKLVACNSNVDWNKFKSVQSILEDIKSNDLVLQCNDIKSATYMLCSRFGVDTPSNNEIEDKQELFSYLLNRCQSKQDSKVYIGTIHSVKGLEYKSVVVIGVNGKTFSITCEDNENLLYTACTRAKKNLIVFKSNKNK